MITHVANMLKACLLYTSNAHSPLEEDRLMPGKIWFVGAGPGDPDLITVKGRTLLEQAGAILFAGSLVDQAATLYAPGGCEIRDSKDMTLDEMTAWLLDQARRHAVVVRLQTGDPGLYGAPVPYTNLDVYKRQLLTYITTSVQLAWAFPDPVGGFMVSFIKFATIFAITQIPLAISEGLLTVLIFNALARFNPQELQDMNLLNRAEAHA